MHWLLAVLGMTKFPQRVFHLYLSFWTDRALQTEKTDKPPTQISCKKFRGTLVKI